MNITLVVTLGRKREIGEGNLLPWGVSSSAGINAFHEITRGKMILVGRKTWESAAGIFYALSQRDNCLVLTRNADYQAQGARTVQCVDTVLEIAKATDVCVVGGAETYEALLPYATEMRMTVVDAAFPAADKHFPEYDRTGWKEKTQLTTMVPRGKFTNFPLLFITLERISPTA